jgi:hypothetical protein
VRTFAGDEPGFRNSIAAKNHQRRKSKAMEKASPGFVFHQPGEFFGGGLTGAQLDTTTGAPRGRNVAQASSPASSGGVSPHAPANSQRDAVQTRSRDGCATVAVPSCARLTVKSPLFSGLRALVAWLFHFFPAGNQSWFQAGTIHTRFSLDDRLAARFAGWGGRHPMVKKIFKLETGATPVLRKAAAQRAICHCICSGFPSCVFTVRRPSFGR